MRSIFSNPTKSTRNLQILTYLLLLFSSSIYANIVNINVYLNAYPKFLATIENYQLIWKDGTKMPIQNRTTTNSKFYPSTVQTLLQNDCFRFALNNPDLFLQILIPYPIGPINKPPAMNHDPGRIRYVSFFQKMYGTTEEEVMKHLVEINWLPKTFKGNESTKILVTTVNDIDKIFTKISDELDILVQAKPEYKKFLKNPAGTFSWRLIAGTTRPSAHSFGMTIDINTEYSNYWLWDYKRSRGLPLEAIIKEDEISPENVPEYKNQIPWEIVEIFEQNYFIWGGKWYHYDTMHFEYRPELFK